MQSIMAQRILCVAGVGKPYLGGVRGEQLIEFDTFFRMSSQFRR
jgi:hypothetical protein